MIVGSPTSFGRIFWFNGFSLRQMVNGILDQYKPLGEIKISVQKFYRINGDLLNCVEYHLISYLINLNI